MTEASLRAAFRKKCKVLFPDVLRVSYPQSGAGYRGFPDEFYIVRGKIVALEWKLPGKRVTAVQAQALAEIRRAGGVATVVHSVDEATRALTGALG